MWYSTIFFVTDKKVKLPKIVSGLNTHIEYLSIRFCTVGVAQLCMRLVVYSQSFKQIKLHSRDRQLSNLIDKS